MGINNKSSRRSRSSSSPSQKRRSIDNTKPLRKKKKEHLTKSAPPSFERNVRNSRSSVYSDDAAPIDNTGGFTSRDGDRSRRRRRRRSRSNQDVETGQMFSSAPPSISIEI